ncbi:hypothetical protein L7F22_022127 [Adiantum nelumboides]|nr:hypothetical protein [Adiantum nelumboides]
MKAVVATMMAGEDDPFTEVKFVGGNKCGDQDSKVWGHAEKEDVLDKDGAVRKPTEDAEGQIKTSKDQVEKETGENSNMESGRKDAATSNIGSLDHIISMIAKSTMKDPPDVDTSFRFEGQLPCASNIEDQEDKNTEFFVLITGEDTEIIIKKSEPPQETGDASLEVGGDASCAGGAVGASGADEDMEIINEKSKPPQENGDALVDASEDAICAGDAGEDMAEPPQENGDASEDAICAGDAGEDMAEPPQENGDASVDASVDPSCKGGAVGAGEGTAEPPQENGDPYVDVGGDASCAGGAIGASAAKYVRHDDGTVPHPWEDGGDARGVASYVRNDDGTVSRPWEDPRNIQFECKPTIIVDINGFLLTSVDKRYFSQMTVYWSGLEIVDKAGVFAGYKGDAPAFLDWCLVQFDVFVWTCYMKNKEKKILRACFPAQFHQFKEILAQQDCVKDARFKLTSGKPVFYKKLSDFWEKRGRHTATSIVLVDDTQYKQLWNPPGTFCIVKNMKNQNPIEIQGYLTTTVRSWLTAWLCAKDHLKYAQDFVFSRPIDNLSVMVAKRWRLEYYGLASIC